MFKRLFGICLAFGMAATAPPALAATCGMRDSLVEQLTSRYSEQLAVGGLQKTRDTQAVMEVWASTETGTFTVLLTTPNGISCVMAAGTDYFEVARPARLEGSAS